ncbi:MAG: 30S ribosomal protein S17 [Microgenomates group bacterium ADurb.Bin219]|nr:MAG: 30S ribosomal protein S17 [Microgenomates group bacterium ADurb.Bin219]HNP89213.1 30S ribosomal protein S17 [Candidatus Woesebacteria bacterium]
MKIFIGKIISNKMNRAAIVEVSFVKKHPLYHKRMQIKRKIHAQNLIGAKNGDLVKITECRPLSKTISFKIQEVVS